MAFYKRIITPTGKYIFVVWLSVFCTAGIAFGQSKVNTVKKKQAGEKAALKPPQLTMDMMKQYAGMFEFLLDISLNPGQIHRLQNGLKIYWEKNDQQAIRQTLENLAYYEKKQELESLKKSSQQVIVTALRGNTNDSVAAVLVEAYDAAYPDRTENTRVQTISDLAGVWKMSDGLLAERTPGGQPLGASFTNSATLEISVDGHFKHTKVNNHCSGNCCQMNGSTEYGTISIQGGKLVFDIQSGTGAFESTCNPGSNKQVKTGARRESFPWSVRPNPNNNNIPVLCWNIQTAIAVCYDKQ